MLENLNLTKGLIFSRTHVRTNKTGLSREKFTKWFKLMQKNVCGKLKLFEVIQSENI